MPASIRVTDKHDLTSDSGMLAWRLAALRVEFKLLRLQLAVRKYGYDPTQPRAAAGSPIGGQWIDGNVEQPILPNRLHIAIDISGFTKHGINRAIERTISPEAILDAVTNPLRIRPRPNGSTQFIGGSATVVLDPTGVVITIWPRRSF